jgi:uncharacterized membrane protein YhaH (DUF805 family)
MGSLFSVRNVIVVLAMVSFWLWNKFGNFKGLIQNFGIEALQVLLLLSCAYSLIVFRRREWYYKAWPMALILISVLYFLGKLKQTDQFMIAYPVFSILSLYFLISLVKRDKNQQNTGKSV